jgi:hypothetical protein
LNHNFSHPAQYNGFFDRSPFDQIGGDLFPVLDLEDRIRVCNWKKEGARM